MKDVAQEAGVSLGTVSKVINGIPVGKAYRIRVEKAIKTLNYPCQYLCPRDEKRPYPRYPGHYSQFD